MKTFLLLCACALAPAIQALSQTVIGRQNVDSFLRNSYGGQTYALTWLPQSYSSTTREYPLIIFLHGAGETGSTTSQLSKLTGTGLSGRIAGGFNAVAVNPKTGIQDSFIVVSPQAASWSYSYTELKYILPGIINKYRVDRSRIYLTGLSAGGGGTVSTFGSRDSTFIKNFAAMATASSAGTNASNGYTSVEVESGLKFGSSWGVKMWTVAGEGDYLLTTDVRYHDSTNWLNPVVKNKLTVIAGVGHSAWNQMYNPAFRPVINYYGNTGTCNNGCAFGGVPVAPNTNGTSLRGSGVTQDSLNVYEWLLMWQRPQGDISPNVDDYKSNAPKPGGGKWSAVANWRRFDGKNWVTTTRTPAATNGRIIISANDSLEVDAAVNADQIIIETNGALNLQGGGISVTNGPGTDVLVDGTLYLHHQRTLNGLGTVSINGTFNWLGGTLDAATETSNTALTNITGNNQKFLNTGFINRGVINWSTGSTAGDIVLTNAVFTNVGTVQENFSISKGIISGGGGNSFINKGVFKKTSTNAFLNNGVPFTNTGILQGIGSYNFTPGSITNTGFVKPGNSPGILTVSEGTLSGQNSTINIEVFNGSGPGNGHNRLDLTGNIPLNGNRLVVFDNFSAPSQSYTILTTTGIFTGTFSQVTLPPGFAIIYNSNSVVLNKTNVTLPAIWGDFYGVAKETETQLNWYTLQEENTDYFEVEYAVNGTDFIAIGSIGAQGSSAATTFYTFTHRLSLNTSVRYYRLKLVDKDGKYQYSQKIALRSRSQNNYLQLQQNIINNNLQLTAFSKDLYVILADMNGKIVLRSRIREGYQSISTGSLSTGIYKLIVYRQNEIAQTLSLLKQQY
jgi:hypothetical protein